MAKTFSVRKPLVCVAILFAFAFAACGGQHASSPVVPKSAAGPLPMAVVGDNEAQLLANAKLIQRAGQHTAYLTVTEPNKSYTFAVYAKFLRSAAALIVRAYGKVYIFPLGQTKIDYSDQHTPIDIADIPQISAAGIDAAIQHGRKPSSFISGQIAQKKALCPDCIALMMDRTFIHHFAAKFHSIDDPWQKARQYAVWRPTSPQPGGASAQAVAMAYSQCSTYSTYTEYSWFNGSGQLVWTSRGAGQTSTRCTSGSSFPSLTGGGGGDGGPATPTPNPGLQPGCSSASQTAAKALNNNFSSAQAASKSGGEWEDMGYIYKDASGNYYYYDEGNLQLNSAGQTTIPNPPNLGSDYTLEGWYHSHPDTYTFDNGNGIDPNGTHFSPEDITTTQELGVPGYVAENNDQGPNSGDPANDLSQESFQWYSTNGTPIPGTSNPTKYYETPNGVLDKSKGC